VSPRRPTPDCPPIGDHGVIGDLNTVALVAMDGTIDFMCFPSFDSPTLFAALLDHARGGAFRLAPRFAAAQRKQMYLPDTCILLTRFMSADGVAELCDFMPIEEMGHAHDLIRRVRTIRGEVEFELVFDPRFDYGRAAHRVEKHGATLLFIPDAPNLPTVRLRSTIPLAVRRGRALSRFTLKAGQSVDVILEELQDEDESPSSAPDYADRAFQETIDYWRIWLSRSSYHGRWGEMVNRSALTLKLLTFRPTGALLAAPTFGLPETSDHRRNFDYRFTWIRDASFTVYAFLRLGFTDEAASFIDWLSHRCDEIAPDGSLRVIYGIHGCLEPAERELTPLRGYRGAGPVRIGNADPAPNQIDIYGELLDSIYLYNKFGAPIADATWRKVTRHVEYVCAHWRDPDRGIWDLPGEPHEYAYSRLMCWVAVDRAIRLALKRSFPAPLDRWREIRDAIYNDLMENFWDTQRQSFIQAKDSPALDAACLMMPMVKFVGPTDPRWIGTLRAIERHLAEDALVYRHRYPDGAPPDAVDQPLASFSVCSFWYAECLSRMGELDRARLMLEKMFTYSNHLGLFSAEIGPNGELLGCFPQALTHLGLISAAYDLNRRLSRAGASATGLE